MSLPTARLRRWQRIAQLAIDGEDLQRLRAALVDACKAPDDRDRRDRLRVFATKHDLLVPLVPLLIAEAYVQRDPAVLAMLRDETATGYAAIGESQTGSEPLGEDPDVLERVAFASYLVGDWDRAAALLERIAAESPDDAAVCLHAAGRLYRNSGFNDRAMAAYRAVVVRRPSDVEALKMIASIVTSPAIKPFAIAVAAPAVAPAPVAPAAPAPVAPAVKRPRLRLGPVDQRELDAELSKALFDAPEPWSPEPAPPERPSDSAIPIPIPRETSLATQSPITANVIAAAKAWAASGDIAGAEQRLRAFIEAKPDELAGHLALVDLLRANKRIADAADYLHGALARELPADHRAALLHRQALVTLALGEADDAVHEILREAHALDGASLSIALAFGESSFSRHAWADAAGALGELGVHPEAATRVQPVTRALVHAAVAEVNLGSRERAIARCEAALALDPACASARRMLTALG